MSKVKKVKNPLRKRYLRELKQDFGKYLVIFLFFVMLISLVSSYLVVADSIETTFYDNFDIYNIEDGHITFSQEPDADVLKSIEEQGDLKLYDLQYVEETAGDAKIRIYKDRTEVDKACIYDGSMPAEKDEIVIDRVFAGNNGYEIGDTILIAGKDMKITGFVSLVDYTSMFESESAMMFDVMTFSVAIVTDEGYDYIDSNHVFYNYAWQFNDEPATKKDAQKRSDELTDILEDIIKDYDTEIIQAEVDKVYDDATDIQEQLEDEFDACSDEIDDKTTQAAEDAFTNAQSSLSQETLMSLYMSGADAEDYLDAAAKAQGTTTKGLIAKQLGTTEDALLDLEDAVDEYQDEMDSMEDSTSDRPVVNLDDIDDGYENEMDFSLDDVRNIVEKIDATGLYDVSKINSLLDELEGLMDFQFDKEKLLMIDNYVLRVESKSANYVMDDMSSDRPMYIVFDYIVVAILAFIFAVTVSNTITAEAGAIGTLRASGYTKGELVRHYITLPIIVTIVAAVVGNLLGYLVFPKYYLQVFYQNFSLAPYEERFNMTAFIDTTVVPLILMFVINLIVLNTKLSISPMRFLRHDLTKKKKGRAVLLNKKIPFLTRFRLRILFQNIPAYLTLAVGILLGAVIVIFGLMFSPLLDEMAEKIEDSTFCTYQYVLKDQVETDDPEAEKYCVTSLDTNKPGYLVDEISIYGIEKDSRYVTIDIPEGETYVSNGMMKKYGYSVGDSVTLTDPISDKEYSFKIAGEYQYDAALCVFMNRDDYNDTFGEKDDYYSGYFTNTELDDIEDEDIAAIVTGDDVAKVAKEMKSTMGSLMGMFTYFGIIMFLLLMYLMTKQVIEKNMQSIAMTKILGFRNGEVARLYLVMCSIVVVASLAISVPVTKVLMKLIFDKYIYMELSGYIPCTIAESCYVKEVIIGIVCYAVVCFFMMFKINRIPKSEALKNVE